MQKHSLTSLGWHPFFEACFNSLDNSNLKPGRVSVAHRTRFGILCEHGELVARIAGKMMHKTDEEAEMPVTGDWVAIEPRLAEGKATIHSILPRRTKISRKVPGKATEEQILLANIDVLFVVSGLDQDYNLRRIERFVLLAWENSITPVIVLNKSDLCEDPQARRLEVEAVSAGADVHLTCALESETVEALRPWLSENRTCGVAGSSGVGKSTIVNALLGRERQKTSHSRLEDGKGRHTTTQRELILLPDGGLIIDTPGLRELQLWGTEDTLAELYEDIEAISENCHFSDCTHESEPGCAVTAAVEEGEIDEARFNNYKKMQKELLHLKSKQDVRMRANTKRRWKQIHKDMRKLNKGRWS